MEKFKFIGEGFNKSFVSKEDAILYIANKRPVNDEYFTLEHSIVTTTQVLSNLPKISNNYELLDKIFDNIIEVIDNKIKLPETIFCKSKIDIDLFATFGIWKSLDYNKSYYEKYLHIINYIKSFNFNGYISNYIKIYNIITNFKPCNNICICLPYYFTNYKK